MLSTVSHKCLIPECNKKRTHMSSAHVCSVCRNRGHSKLECPLITGIQPSQSYSVISGPYNCQVFGCRNPTSHDTSYHHCDNCKLICHGCSRQAPKIKCPICRRKSIHATIQSSRNLYRHECPICFETTKRMIATVCDHSICIDCFNIMRI